MASTLVETTIHGLRRAGVFITRALRSIWVQGATIAAFERAAPMIRDIRVNHPKNRLLLTSSEASVCRWLRSRYPGHAVMPPPWGASVLFHRRFFRELDPKILVWLGLDDQLPLGLLREARRRGLPIVAVGERARIPVELERRVGPWLDGFVEGSAPSAADLAPFFARLSPDSPRHLHARRRTRSLAESGLGRRLAEARSERRIADWQALRERLGAPRTILCLGNGPSSEEPAVVATPHDCLMRVNHRWRERGILTRPDVVFVGNLRTTLRVPPPCVFGFRGIGKEREVLLRHLLLGFRRGALEHFTLERMGSPLDTREWPATPTNGAVMVAAAVRLRPERLVIAGIDLYQDARGIYPGQTVAENEYLRGHEREVEVAVIAHALAEFRGEVIVLAPNLARALEAVAAKTA